MKSNLKKIWNYDAEEKAKLDKMTSDELNKAIHKNTRDVHFLNAVGLLMYLIVIIYFLYFLIGGVHTLVIGIKYYLNYTKTANLFISQINSSTTYNGVLTASTIKASSLQASTQSDLGIITLGWIVSVAILCGVILLFDYLLENSHFHRKEIILWCKKLKATHITRICDYCVEKVPHSEFTHTLNMYKTDFWGKRTWISASQAVKEVKLQNID